MRVSRTYDFMDHGIFMKRGPHTARALVWHRQLRGGSGAIGKGQPCVTLTQPGRVTCQQCKRELKV